MYDLIIIGGGASGLASAISAKRRNEKLNILLLEKTDSLGKKILASGNGKCNISNTGFMYYKEVKDFFLSLGISFIVDYENRCYPINGDSKSVLDALKKEIDRLNISYKLNSKVTSILKEDDTFKVNTGSTIYEAKSLVIATGGKSYPTLGTTGDGYVFLRNLGLKINTLIPGLTKVKVSENLEKYKGVRQKGKVGLYEDGKLIKTEEGEVQFRLDAVSGICIMNLSNFIRNDHKYILEMDFRGHELNKKIDSEVLKFNVTGLLGWKEAQVTCGGLDLDEINLDTYEVKKINNLYVLGETLDIAYICGGFNLSNAFISGIKFGENFEI